jgi:integrase/recombinase XerD
MGTDLLKHDVPSEQVPYLLGHADARTTDLYNRTSKEVSRSVVGPPHRRRASRP